MNYGETHTPQGICEGAAWLSSARAVRCRLKCHNERNPYLQLLTGHAAVSYTHLPVGRSCSSGNNILRHVSCKSYRIFGRRERRSIRLFHLHQVVDCTFISVSYTHLDVYKRQVTVIEPIGGIPSSLSRNVVYDLLTDELAFKGLIFTDALAMRLSLIHI